MKAAILEFYNSQIAISHNAVAAENVTAIHFHISIRDLHKIIYA